MGLISDLNLYKVSPQVSIEMEATMDKVSHGSGQTCSKEPNNVTVLLQKRQIMWSYISNNVQLSMEFWQLGAGGIQDQLNT